MPSAARVVPQRRPRDVVSGEGRAASGHDPTFLNYFSTRIFRVYQQVELTTGSLPWKNVQDMNQVGDFKKRVRANNCAELIQGCPRECAEASRRVAAIDEFCLTKRNVCKLQALNYIDGLKFYDTPNYSFLYGLMRRAFTSMGVQEFPCV